MSEKNNLDLAIEYGHKFDFYFIALIFTVLGLTIQTAPSNATGPALFFEILSWVLLTVSGFSGLLRVEYIPVAYKIFHEVNTTEEKIKAFVSGLSGREILKEDGDPWREDEMLQAKENLEKHLLEGKKRSKELESQNLRKYRCQKSGALLPGLFY